MKGGAGLPHRGALTVSPLSIPRVCVHPIAQLKSTGLPNVARLMVAAGWLQARCSAHQAHLSVSPHTLEAKAGDFRQCPWWSCSCPSPPTYPSEDPRGPRKRGDGGNWPQLLGSQPPRSWTTAKSLLPRIMGQLLPQDRSRSAPHGPSRSRARPWSSPVRGATAEQEGSLLRRSHRPE